MDIAKITEFMNYKMSTDADPRDRIEKIFESLPYLTENDQKSIRKAYEFSLLHHADAVRLSGEPYIIHPVSVAEYLVPLHPDAATIQAALMHDLIEDTVVTTEDVIQLFGEEVATLCDGLVKVSTVRRRGEERQLETLKKTFLAMGRDLRVIFIKIADRVHNIQTLHFHPNEEKRIRIALETLKVYVPIAKRLGLYVLQGYLENGSFAQLEPKEYKRIVKYVNKYYSGGENYKNIGIQRLERLCQEEGLTCEMLLGRVKSPYRIWRKLKKYQSSDITKIMDVLAFRIITEKVSDCYMILGIMHKHYTPIFAKMKDYIAIPKPNGYKSLHTTVLGMFDFPVEIQVRTEKMDQIANYGVAAHFAYSDEEVPENTVSEIQAEWISRLQDIVTKYRNSTDKESFKHELDIEILQQTIFVYTPKGDIIELPLKSSLLDFAFRVHTDIGLKFKNGFVNGKIVPLDYRLKTGDIISIDTFKNKITANRGWLRYLHTPGAKTKLQRYIRQQEREEIFARTEKKINIRLSEFDLPLLHAKSDKITKTYSGEAYESLLYKLYDGQLRIVKLLKQVYPVVMEEQLSHISHVHGQDDPIAIGSSDIVVVDGHIISNYELCPECGPHVGDTIIGKSGKEGVKIHTSACTALHTVDTKRLLESHRLGEQSSSYTVSFTVVALQKPGALLQLLRIVERFGMNIQSLVTKESQENQQTTITFVIVFTNPATLGYLVNEILEKTAFLDIEYVFQ